MQFHVRVGCAAKHAHATAKMKVVGHSQCNFATYKTINSRCLVLNILLFASRQNNCFSIICLCKIQFPKEFVGELFNVMSDIVFFLKSVFSWKTFYLFIVLTIMNKSK